MTRRISSSRPMTGSSLPARASAVRSRPYFSSACVGALRVRRGHALAAADALERLEDRLRAAPWRSSSCLAPRRRPRRRRGAGARSRRTRRRAGGPPPRPARRRAWPAGRAPASRPGSGRASARIAATSPRNAGRSTPSRRSVSAGMPSSGSTSAVRRCSASRTGLWSRSAVCLGGDDGLLGLLGEAIELHVGSLSGLRRRSARVGLVDEVEEGRGGLPGLVGQVGRQDDADLDEGRRGLAPEARHALAGEPERPAGLGARRDPSAGPALERRGPGPPRRAAPPRGVTGSSRSRSAPRRVKTGRGAGRTTT